MNREKAIRHFTDTLYVEFSIAFNRVIAGDYIGTVNYDTGRVNVIKALEEDLREMNKRLNPLYGMSLEEQDTLFKGGTAAIANVAKSYGLKSYELTQEEDEPEFIDPDEVAIAERREREKDFKELYGAGAKVILHAERLLLAIKELNSANGDPEKVEFVTYASLERTQEVFDVLVSFYEKRYAALNARDRNEMEELHAAVLNFLDIGQQSDGVSITDLMAKMAREAEEIKVNINAYNEAKHHLLAFCEEVGIRQKSGIELG